MSARGAYNWKSSITPKLTEQEMVAEGRRPIATNRGEVFASRPGAPNSVNDSQAGLGITAPLGSMAHDAAWDNFFNKGGATATTIPAPTLGASDVSADEAFGGGTSTGAPAIPAPVASAIQTNQNWMRSNGVAFPPPPTPRAPLFNPTGTNQIVKPSLNSDPARTAGGGVSPSALAAPAMNFNRSLYAAADTLPGGAGYAPIPGASVPTNWVTTTADQAAAIKQRYGT